MNSFINNSIINQNYSLTNNQKYLLPFRLNDSKNKKYAYNSKNKSRNNKNIFLLITESNLKNNTTNINSFFKTSSNIKAQKNTNLFPNNSKKKPIKIKKDLFKKKMKELFKNIEENENRSVFKNKAYLFEQISHDKERTPKVKTQEQLNYYLINDFKENEPMKIEINKSKKNKKMDEEFDIYKTYLKEKQYNKNIYLIKEYKRKNEIQINKNKKIYKNDSIDYSESLNNNDKKDDTVKFKRKSKKKLTFYRPAIFYKDIYKNYHKNKERDSHENYKSQINVHYSHKSNNNFKSPSKQVREIFQLSASKKRKFSNTHINNNKIYISKYLYNNNHTINNKTNPKYFSKNEKAYKEEKKKYNIYIRKIKKLRANNYVEQIKKLELEENKLKKFCKNDDYNKENKIKLSELNIERLLLEVKKKNIFLDSFGIAGKNIKDKEDDVDEDNFNGLKNYHINLGMGATYIHNLKLKIEPRYILKHFKKKTIDKYKGNKGIFFGPHNKRYEIISK